VSGQGSSSSSPARSGRTPQATWRTVSTRSALASVGAGWGNVVQFTSYLVNAEDIPKYMAYRAGAYPGFFPNRVYPTHTLLVIDRLVREDLLVEVQAIAALP
jgi:enamine deaminase RidA (YjgF/YER057c/UK114 family)